MSDADLLSTTSMVAAARRQLDGCAGALAAEIAHRSRREYGYDGLAQKQGFRTPEALVQTMTGSTRADATTLVRVGTMVADTAAADQFDGVGAPQPVDPADDGDGTPGSDRLTSSSDPNWWRAGVARGVAAGTISYAQADAIRVGLGEPTETITAELLTDAVCVLVDAATNPGMPLTVDELRKLARQLRDSIDADGLAEREHAQQDAQYIKAWKRADGMVGGALLLDRENGAYLMSVIDELTSPRRGGPRFVDLRDKARAQKLIDDPRSTERIAVEGVMQLLRIGVDADENIVYGSRKPAVRIVVTRDTVAGAPGTDSRGVIQDTGESVSVATIERTICNTGSVSVTVDTCGRPLDVGREQRLLTAKQKLALSVRDGGCVVDGCDRPPSWTEAHHIDHYVEHNGLTNIDDGILLCRFHHLLLHNSGWRITRADDRYFLRMSRDDDPRPTVIELHSKNPLTRARQALEHSARQRAG